MKEYTQGPWKVGSMHRRVIPAHKPGIVNDGQVICEVYGNRDRRANCRLIAAAPKLLEALEDMLAFGVEQDDHRIPYLTVQIDRETIEAAKLAVYEATDQA